jgi:ribosome biogenesis GTPase
MPGKRPRKSKGEKVRVPFRRNRSPKKRDKDWTGRGRDAEGHDVEAARIESVVPKGDISRQRTIIVGQDRPAGEIHRGVVVAMRGLYADVDDGTKVVACTIRRILRTRQIDDRGAIAVGDRVGFVIEPQGTAKNKEPEGVIESVEPRTGQLQRLAGRRVQTIAANVDQAIIVSSAGQPQPKPHLIDRYIISAHAGQMKPVICMNKIDLDIDGFAGEMLERYEALGYRALRVSATTSQGLDHLRDTLKNQTSVIAGQSGVGKSSLLNAIQPGLKLRIGGVHEQTEKGTHTTTTAVMLRLAMGGYVVDTPGIRSFDISIIPRDELEAYFVEFVPLVEKCRYPSCTHVYEVECAIKNAVERGEIHPDRYATYLALFEESS